MDSLKKIRIEEWLIIIMWLISNIIINLFSRPYTYNFFDYIIFLHRIVLGQSWLYPLIMLFLFREFSKEKSPIHRIKELGFQSGAFHLLRDFAPLFGCFIIYSNLKVMLPNAYAKYNFETLLQKIDNSLLGSFSPAIWMQNHFPAHSEFWDPIFGRIYIYFFASFFLACLLVYYYADKKTFRKFQLNLILVYLVGLALYFLVPALGPAFINPEYYSTFKYKSINTLVRVLYNNRIDYITDPANHPASIFEGVAAFPSLHIAHTLTFLLFMLKLKKKPLIILFSIWFPLNYLSTLYCGTHYFIDGIGGIIVAGIIYVIVEYLGKYMKEEGDPA